MDRMVLTSKQQKLVLNNYGLARDYIYKSFKNKFVSPIVKDEFISEVLWRFCVSACYYDETLGFKFSTFAYKGFMFGLGSVLAENEKNAISSEGSDFLEKYEIELKNNPIVEDSFLKDFIDNSSLDSREKKMLRDHYLNNLSFRSLGENYNLSAEGSRLIIKKAVVKLKFEINRNKLSMEDFYI